MNARAAARQHTFEPGRAVAGRAGPRLFAGFVPALGAGVGVLHAEEVEVLLPVGPLFLERCLAEARLDPLHAPVGQLARLGHVAEILAAGHRSAPQRAAADGTRQRPPPARLHARRHEITHDAIIHVRALAPGGSAPDTTPAMGSWVRGLAGVAVLLAVTPDSAQRRLGRRQSARTGAVAGRVVRPDGLPQPDAQVVLAAADGRGRAAPVVLARAHGVRRPLRDRRRAARTLSRAGARRLERTSPRRAVPTPRSSPASRCRSRRPGGRCRRPVHRRHRRVAGALAPPVHVSAAACSGPAARRPSTRW